MLSRPVRHHHGVVKGIAKLFMGLLVIAGLLWFRPTPTTQAVGEVTVGSGSYTTVRPAGTVGPSDFNGNPVTPKTASPFSGPVQTNDWWSSLIWQYFPGNTFSENMFPHPLALHAKAGGLGVGYPTTPAVSATDYHYNYTEELTIGVAGLNAPSTRVAGYSDWAVTAAWQGSPQTMQATFGHGLPFVYVTKSGGDATVSFPGTPTIWHNSGGVVGATINGHHYGIFGPAGSTWSGTTTLQSSLTGKNYFSVAVLPDNTAATLEFYRRHAYAFVTNTRVSWQYDEATARLMTTFQLTTELKESGNNNVNNALQALYRHQWANTTAPTTAYTYASPRGTMKVVDANSFTTALTFNGVLPALPDVGTYDRNQLYTYVNEAHNGTLFPADAVDTYWTGKALGRLAALVPLAEQVGHTAARDRFLTAMKGKLEEWLSATNGGGLFYYDDAWDTMIGYPASYGSDTQLNDHHFHYGYYIIAAATVAQYDPAWAATSQWGGMVQLLVKDPANWDRTDTRFPFLRSFDAYAGHPWASGPSLFAAGNNQESSSESMNFATSLILWGSATGDTTLRDLGIFLYANETHAIEQYWFDVDQTTFPSSFNHEVLGILWGDGGSYATWWTANPEEIHGINYLPITGGSLYLGRRPDYITRNYNELVANNGGPEQEWRDIIWGFHALQNPGATISKFGSGGYVPEAGESKAHTYHWIHALNALGQLDTSVTANIPTYAVFVKNGTRTYVAFNPGSSARNVTFSNGTWMSVPARSLAFSNGSVGPTPTPTRTGTATPTPTRTGTATITPTPTRTPTSGPISGNTLYILDGAALGTTGALSFTAGGGAASDTIPSAGGGNYDGTPHDPLVYQIQGISGSYVAGQSSAFNVFLDAGNTIGNGSQVRVSYDFTGDGTYDRVETYFYFATNDVPDWQSYTHTQGVRTVTGSYANLANGRIRIELWNAIGNGTTALRTSATSANGQQSALTLPFSNLTGGSGNPTATPTRTPTATATRTPTRTPTRTLTPTPRPVSNTLFVLDGAALGTTGALSFTAGGGAASDTIPTAGGGNYDGTPRNPLVYTITGVSGTYSSGQASAFTLYLDAGANVGDGSQLRISYDFDGNGSTDRSEIYHYFPTNDVPGWEAYNQTRGLKSSSGTFANLNRGRITIEVWNAIGTHTVNLRTSATSANGQQSTVQLPFTNLSVAP